MREHCNAFVLALLRVIHAPFFVAMYNLANPVYY